MIGVLSRGGETRAVEEFFELFKTPWEFYVPYHDYDVVIATCEEIPTNVNTKLSIIYSSGSTAVDDEMAIATESKQKCEWLDWNGVEFPIYGGLSVFQAAGKPLIRRRGTVEGVGIEVQQSGQQTTRIGYDLFHEVSSLLCEGQPSENAHVPTLEIHISILRAILLSAGIPFAEVPPVPAGWDFAACLTHDVDFTGIRNHRFDHTMWGFVYRAFIGSLRDALTGRVAWSKCFLNWRAALSLPLVYLGLQDDFWLEFDRYMQIESGLGSTFFFIPFRNVAGTWNSRPAPKRREAKYDLSEIKEQVPNLAKNGSEIGLHGIDAWQNAQKAGVELSRIREMTGQHDVGTRMHWLYWTEASPKALEQAGFAYDSTFGYNDAVGFRAGTTQAFRPLGAATLLELPLNIQDTALFYSDRMNLSEAAALDACKRLINSALRFGGALTVNWHTRSLSPERLWGDFYTKLLGEIRAHRVWFGNAGNIVGWFRSRRAIRFDCVRFEDDHAHVALSSPLPTCVPPLNVRIYYPTLSPKGSASSVPEISYKDTQWNGEQALEIPY